jgi:AraC-like DNA-binding protein
MEKDEILKRLGSQLQPAEERSYMDSGQFFWYGFEPRGNQSPLNVIWGGRALLKPGTEIKRSSYPYYAISYLRQGHGSFTIHDRTHELAPGTVSGHCPGTPHRFNYDADHQAENLFVVFTGPEALELMKKSTLANQGAISLDYPEHYLHLLLRIQEQSLEMTANSANICSSYLRILLLGLADLNVQSKPASKAEATYQECKSVIDANFMTLSSMKELVRLSGWNADYITRLFQRFNGITPSKYLMQIKLERAAMILLDGNARINDIASEMGFSDHYHFSKRFKAYHGLSPAQYRKKHMNH